MKHRMKAFALWGVAIGLCAVGALMAGDVVTVSADQHSDDAPKRQRWIVKMEHGPLKTVAVRDGSGGAKYVHYMTMKVTNDSGHPRTWVPQVLAKTDTGKTYYSGGNAWALKAIQKAEKNDKLVPIEGTSDSNNRLGNGMSKDTVAIFGVVDPLYDRITIEAYGLVDPVAIFRFDIYGEDEVIKDAVYWDRNQKILKRLKAAAADAGGEMPKPTIEYREVREDRYFEMIYERLGDEFGAQDDKIDFVSEAWRARGELKVLRVFGKKSDD